MVYLRRKPWKRGRLRVLLHLRCVNAAPAQGGRGAGAGGGGQAGGGGRGGGPQYTPAAGAKDLKAVLFNWAWYTGMLRSSEERDGTKFGNAFRAVDR
jgi:hypothetical protein